MTKQFITRKASFDSAHRVMNEKFKCFHLHGHTYLYELTFLFTEIEEIGYAIDFKEIKRVGLQWIDDMFDHGTILNRKDTVVIDAVNTLGTKLWLMSLNGNEYCNPSVENIAKEIFLAMECLFETYKPQLVIHTVTVFETPNCKTDCIAESITEKEGLNWNFENYAKIKAYVKEKGIISYDDRK